MDDGDLDVGADGSHNTMPIQSGEALSSYSYVDGTLVTSSGLTGGVYTDLTIYTVFTASAAVPEPATCALFVGLGAIALALYRRRA
jgi:hypothetical protein